MEEPFRFFFSTPFKNQIIRSAHYYYQDVEVLNAIFQEENCSFMKIRPKFMLQVLEYFHTNKSTMEIIFSAALQTVKVRSYHSNLPTFGTRAVGGGKGGEGGAMIG